MEGRIWTVGWDSLGLGGRRVFLWVASLVGRMERGLYLG